MEILFHKVVVAILVVCDVIVAQHHHARPTPRTRTTTTTTVPAAITTLAAATTTTMAEPSEGIADRLQQSRLAQLLYIHDHVLQTLGWDSPPNIDPETKRRLLERMATPVYVTRQKTCYNTLCDIPLVSLPDYVNRSIWFNTTSRHMRYYFNMEQNRDPNFSITSAVVKLHLKHRADCPCSHGAGEHITSRIHIKIYQYRKPVRSLLRLRRNNKRLIDARMVTWDGARWFTLDVTDAVKRIIQRGRRNGGFEIHVKDMDENVIDASTVIDPTVCSMDTEYDCTDSSSLLIEDPEYEHEQSNYSALLVVSSTTTNRIEITR